MIDKHGSDSALASPSSGVSHRAAGPSPRIGAFIVAGALAMLALCAGLYLRAASRTNHVALSARPKPVSVARALSATYRAERSYLGTLAPWASAQIGPQHVSAYVGSMLVRPGSLVQAGEVLGTLDCRSSSAGSRAIAAQARSLEEQQRALSREAERIEQMTKGGFASQNEMEKIGARSRSGSAQLESLRASLSAKALEVNDCVLRAPFKGEVTERLVDPGAFVRPGATMVVVIDRSTIRVTASAPESDYAVIAPQTPAEITVAATGQRLQAPISRRAPGADLATRTVDFEIDIPNTDRALPAGTTAAVRIPVGQGQPAVQVAAPVAVVRGQKATLFLVKDGVAARVVAKVLGERDGQLFLEPGAVPAGAQVVLEGRALLDHGDRVAAQEVSP